MQQVVVQNEPQMVVLWVVLLYGDKILARKQRRNDC
jgi:hypothetical protein